jgi:hypothetical protein
MDDYKPQPGDVWFFAGRHWKSRLIAFLTVPAWIPSVSALLVLFAHLTIGAAYVAFDGCLIVFGLWFCIVHYKISHVGIVAPHPSADKLILYESTTLNAHPCLLMGKTIKGIQAHKLGQRRESYRGRILVARVRNGFQLDEGHRMALSDWLVGQVGREYNTLGAVVSGSRVLKRLLVPIQLTHGWLHGFCSELVLLGLKRVSLVNPGVRASWVTPARLYRICWQSDRFDFQWLKQ